MYTIKNICKRYNSIRRALCKNTLQKISLSLFILTALSSCYEPSLPYDEKNSPSPYERARYRINGKIVDKNDSPVENLLVYGVYRIENSDRLITGFSDTRQDGVFYLNINHSIRMPDGTTDKNISDIDELDIIVKYTDIHGIYTGRFKSGETPLKVMNAIETYNLQIKLEEVSSDEN